MNMRRSIYPLNDIEVGQSFEVMTEALPSVRTLVNRWKNHYGKSFKVRKANGCGIVTRVSKLIKSQ